MLKNLQFARLKLFGFLLPTVAKVSRKRRMELFLRLMKPVSNMKVLDLGGTPKIWDFVELPLRITCLNLPGVVKKAYPSHHQITYVEGDACNMPFFGPGDFDLVFSNSVIEHVGDASRREQFANEVLRLACQYWIQTPSKCFPIEAHSGMPFWWFYPLSLRSYIIERWKKNIPRWAEMVETTTVIPVNELQTIFPDCSIQYEHLLGIPKSIVAYSAKRK